MMYASVLPMIYAFVALIWLGGLVRAVSYGWSWWRVIIWPLFVGVYLVDLIERDQANDAPQSE